MSENMNHISSHCLSYCHFANLLVLMWFEILSPIHAAFAERTTNFCIGSSQYRAKHTTCSDIFDGWNADLTTDNLGGDTQESARNHPIPPMPSLLFQQMAQSQLELLANSIIKPGQPGSSKVESMALYLPQENSLTGQLEFVPVVLFPDPMKERVFIAGDSNSGFAPTLPKALTALPGFAHATTLLPGYPMISSSTEGAPGVGEVEEVLCDPRSRNRAAALSVPLLSGSQTVGVLLVSPTADSNQKSGTSNQWTELDRQQVSRAAQSLSMALTMDIERSELQEQNSYFRQGLSDSLHQVKNPVQALRTYGKLLQRRIAKTETSQPTVGNTPHILELVENMMAQSERVVDLLVPMDTLVNTLESKSPNPYILNPAPTTNNEMEPQSLVLWRERPESSTEFHRETKEGGRHAQAVPSNDRAKTKQSFQTPTPEEETEFEIRSVEGRRNTTSHRRKAERNTEKTALTPMSDTLIGDSEMEMTFVSDILEPIFAAFRAIGSERGIDFEIVEETDELPGVMAAPKSLQEAVSNVLNNAFSYVTLVKPGSPFTINPSPRVRVRIFSNKSAIDPKNSQPGVTILVEDNGPGIREEEREAIFERGFRSPTTMAVEGSGIGLDICRTLMKRMGGILNVAKPNEFGDSLDGAVLELVLFRNPRN